MSKFIQRFMNYELFHKGIIGKKPLLHKICFVWQKACVWQNGEDRCWSDHYLCRNTQPPSSAWTRNPGFLSFTLADKTVAAGLSHYPTDYYMICQNCPGNDIQTVWNPKLEIHLARHLILFSKRIIFKKCWFVFLLNRNQTMCESLHNAGL